MELNIVRKALSSKEINSSTIKTIQGRRNNEIKLEILDIIQQI